MALALGFALLVGLLVLGRRTRRRPADLVSRIGTIDTARLRLRAVSSADADALHATVDEEILTANGLVMAQVQRAHQLLHRPGSTLLNHWLITDRRTGEVFGIVSARPDRPEPSTSELGWWIGPEARGHGYATEAVSATIGALHTAGIPIVRVGTRKDNVAVQRILDKVGAVRVADGPHTLPNGEVIASLWYEHTA